MKLLTFSSLYPNAEMPSHGVFVENRLAHLVANGRVTSEVVAPVPWFPFKGPRFGRFGTFARVPRSERRNGIDVQHPRYFTVPGLGSLVVPLAMALCARPWIAARLANGERFDAIDAHYFFPDGVAAALLGRWFGIPVVITARGSDINEIARRPIPGRMIRWAADAAAAVITVSSALRRVAASLGVAADKIVVLRNGVDVARFKALDRAASRRSLGLEGEQPTVVSVGRLVRGKGHDLVISALARVPGTTLLVAGSGPELDRLQALAENVGVADRVRFLGQVSQTDLPLVYSAADVLVLASENEGWPNVLLEAMSCGTPVLATAVGGCAEVVTAPEAGAILPERSVQALAVGIAGLLAAPPSRAHTRAYAERFSWDETTHGQEKLFESLIPARSAEPRVATP